MFAEKINKNHTLNTDYGNDDHLCYMSDVLSRGLVIKLSLSGYNKSSSNIHIKNRHNIHSTHNRFHLNFIYKNIKSADNFKKLYTLFNVSLKLSYSNNEHNELRCIMRVNNNSQCVPIKSRSNDLLALMQGVFNILIVSI